VAVKVDLTRSPVVELPLSAQTSRCIPMADGPDSVARRASKLGVRLGDEDQNQKD
jgi:hypothetical protein